MDALTLLKNDHRTVEKLFRRFEKAGPRANKEKEDVVARIVEELSIHAAIEETVFYPVVRYTVPKVQDQTLESLEEHHIVKWQLSEIADLDPTDERFEPKVTVLIENVRHHVKEEESDLFPKVRSELTRSDLNDLGEALARAKKSAPTHPHPRSPDTPPANLVVGTAAGVADKVVDTVAGIASGGIDVVEDLIATFTDRKASPTRTTGTKTKKKAAASVRSGAAKAEKRVGKKANAAARRTRSTGRSASSSGRRKAASKR
jgi:hemerythrin superfamily protein